MSIEREAQAAERGWMTDLSLTNLLRLTSMYLPLAGAVVLLLVSTFDSSLLKDVPLELLVAIMAVSFVFVAVHLEQRLSDLSESVTCLDTSLGGGIAWQAERVSALEEAQREYLARLTPDIRTGSLTDAFERALDGRNHVAHLRVYAISSQQIFSFVSNSDITIGRCSLLIQGFPPGHESEFAHQVRLNARDWRRVARSGRIRELEILSYDYFPTDYEVLFDSDTLIFGLFDSDPDDYSKVKLRSATLVEGRSPAADALINEFCERFDNLFEACRTAHGPNLYQEP